MKGITYLVTFAAGIAAAFVFQVLQPLYITAQEPIPTEPAVSSQTEELTAPTEARLPFDASLVLWVETETGCEEWSLREYLAGVLAAEMPASFEAAALESQAIASRTFALKKAQSKRHGAADVCTNSACCQGWKAVSALSEEAQQAIYAAIDDTDGLVAVYDGELIDATFFSCSGGRTEAAAAVWGGEVPYLQAVDSPNEEIAPRYTESRVFTAEELQQAFSEAYPEMQLQGGCSQWFGGITYTAGGGIDTIEIGGVSISGTALRRVLGLRSTRISLRCGEDSVTMTTLGFGHRVGLSQYGAQAMALNGADYTEILTHYYPGITLCRLVEAE